MSVGQRFTVVAVEHSASDDSRTADLPTVATTPAVYDSTINVATSNTELMPSGPPPNFKPLTPVVYVDGIVNTENADDRIPSKWHVKVNHAMEESSHVSSNLEKVTELELYEAGEERVPFVSRIIHELATYDGGVIPKANKEVCDDSHLDPNDDGGCKKSSKNDPGIEQDAKKSSKNKTKPRRNPQKLGTVLGVFFPCIQNIFGVILFIRLVWIVGNAGWLQAFFIVLLCCCCTMTTTVSMSAISTNGKVAGGGSYFMISRALGPEFGGAVGLLFYLANAVAAAMYFVGAVEILLLYMAPPGAAVFGPVNIPDNAYNCYRLYGSVLHVTMFLFVLVGVRFLSRFSPFALLCVLLSILCIYIGIFIASPDRGPRVCFIGERLLAHEKILNPVSREVECDKNTSGPIYNMFCGNVTDLNATNDKDCAFFQDNEVHLKPGIPGLSSGVFFRNTFGVYSEHGDRIGLREQGDRDKGDIICDISTSFITLIGIFFPSVTGFMAGSNRSGDLKDAQRSIPVGTISAVIVTSLVCNFKDFLSGYFFCITLGINFIKKGSFLSICWVRQRQIAYVCTGYGESMGGGLIAASLAWPHAWVILLGSFFSTCGAGLQSLIGAPRLLHAIAVDDIIPFLRPFAVTNKAGEPVRALFLTGILVEAGILLANIDHLAPITTMCFLMCYCFTNLACCLQTLLKTPNWRPRFRFYHWSLSVFGMSLCLALMFLSNWYYALIALFLASVLYKYIEYKGAEKEWGDGLRGLSLSAARFALMRVEEGPPHAKNWRPQLLILIKTDGGVQRKYRKMLTFASQLKAGQGLTLVASVLGGDVVTRQDDVESAKLLMGCAMKEEKCKGLSEVIVSKDVACGISYLIQGCGLGGLRHNTVLLGYPHKWKSESDAGSYKMFIGKFSVTSSEKAAGEQIIEVHTYKIFKDTIRIISSKKLALMIPKGIEEYPENSHRLRGTVDVWWIVHEGGLLMLLPYLLTRNKVWRSCKMRIFTVAQLEDNSSQMLQDLKSFIYQLRLKAEVEVVEMPDRDISAYTYERTMMMEQRMKMLREIRQRKADKMTAPQLIVDFAHQSSMDSMLVAKSLSFSPEPGSGGVELVRYQTLKKPPKDNHYTFSAEAGRQLMQEISQNFTKVDEHCMKRMHTAVRLNQTIRERSQEARLVIVNLPGPPKHESGEENYMEYIEVLTEGLPAVLMVRGGGQQVITICS